MTPEYDWQAFDDRIVFIADIENLPDTQAELERKMAKFMAGLKAGKAPDKSAIRKRVSRLYIALKSMGWTPGKT
jgi:hypothetical protein